MRKFISLSLLISLASCELSESKGILSITIIDEANRADCDELNRVVSQNEHDNLVNMLDKKSTSPVKFIPTHRLVINYDNGTEAVYLINGRYLKVDGTTFLLPNDDLAQFIGELN